MAEIELERETRVELATLCLGSTPAAAILCAFRRQLLEQRCQVHLTKMRRGALDPDIH